MQETGQKAVMLSFRVPAARRDAFKAWCAERHTTVRAHRPCRVHTHSTTGSRLNSLQWSLHILTPFTRRRPPLSQRWSGVAA